MRKSDSLIVRLEEKTKSKKVYTSVAVKLERDKYEKIKPLLKKHHITWAKLLDAAIDQVIEEGFK